jgi:hypothetical protein
MIITWIELLMAKLPTLPSFFPQEVTAWVLLVLFKSPS